jgi:hypothetical protein
VTSSDQLSKGLNVVHPDCQTDKMVLVIDTSTALGAIALYWICRLAYDLTKLWLANQ